MTHEQWVTGLRAVTAAFLLSMFVPIATVVAIDWLRAQQIKRKKEQRRVPPPHHSCRVVRAEDTEDDTQ